MKRTLWFAVAALTVALAPRAAQAQGISFTPQIGVYVPGNSLDSLKAGADEVRVKREGNLALGFNVNLGFLRGSLAYASAAKINRTTTGAQVGDAKLLAVAGDLVLRPIPKLIVVQPYLLVGAGFRNANYSYDVNGFEGFPKDDRDFALHAGVGADLSIGPVGISAEITDFISQNNANKWKQHDGFGFVGLRLGM